MTSAPRPPGLSALEKLHPLDDFFRRRGQRVPPFELLAGDKLPEPYRGLLAHQRDMTGALERFHNRGIHLRILDRWHDSEGCYWRETVLELDGSDQPVEYGAIRIFVARFPDPWRAQILAERRPLGSLLNESGLRYTSRPTAFFRLAPDPFISAAFRLRQPARHYGRQNTLRGEKGEVLAEIVEILPETAPEPAGGPDPSLSSNEHPDQKL